MPFTNIVQQGTMTARVVCVILSALVCGGLYGSNYHLTLLRAQVFPITSSDIEERNTNISGFHGADQSLPPFRAHSFPITTTSQSKNNQTAINKVGRFLIFPFTMYGPNVQLLGLKHAIAVCLALGVQCVEPGFSDLFAEHFYELGDFIDIKSHDLLLPRSTLPSPLQPQVFLYGSTGNGEPRWPDPPYFDMHNITLHSAPPEKGYARTVLCASQKGKSHAGNVNSTLNAVKQELRWFQDQAQSEADHVVALVYSAALGNANHHPPPPLTKPFLEVSQKLRPVDTLHEKADSILKTIFPKGVTFLAMHLRLRDHCKTSIQECCCETSGNNQKLTMFDIESFAEKQMRRFSTRYLFISGPPALERLVAGWDWLVRNKDTVKLWYSKTAPGSLEESTLQQVICSKATAFFISVPSSTWSGSVIFWQAKGATAEGIVSDSNHGPLSNFSTYSVGVPTEQHDNRLDLAYLPTKLAKISEGESSFLRELEHRLEFTSSRSHCNENSTMFAMLRNDGLGASFHFVHLALGIAVAHGLSLATMNIKPNGKWAWGTMCKTNDWNCMFKPTHSCVGLQLKQNQIQKSWSRVDKPCPAPWCLAWNRRQFNYDMKESLSLGVPRQGVTAVLYRAKLTQFLFRLNAEVQERVDARTFGFVSTANKSTKTAYLTLKQVTASLLAHGIDDPPIIAMHVRQGDSCKDPRKIRKCFSLAEYMKAATKMKNLYGSDTIVVATDSEEVIANITSHYKEWNWYFQNITRSKYDVKDEKEYLHGGNIPAKMLKSHPENSADIQIESVTDLFALSLGSAFVGTFTSDFSRLAFELVSARAADHVPPYVSLAGTFCQGNDPITERPVYLCK